MNEAIKLAIEKGGYEPRTEKTLWLYSMATGEFGCEDNHELYAYEDVIDIKSFLLDPLFWQALGKPLGWKKKYTNAYLDLSSSHYKNGQEFDGWIFYETKHPEWQYHAHRWLDAHFEGPKAEEKFWKELLK